MVAYYLTTWVPEFGVIRVNFGPLFAEMRRKSRTLTVGLERDRIMG